MTTLVVGATGNTGQLVVKQLLKDGRNVRVIVRSRAKMQDLVPEHIKSDDDNSKLTIVEASLLDLPEDELIKNVKECDSIVSCLGHNLTYKGMYGEPRRLVTDAARRLCDAIIKAEKKEESKNNVKKFILMGSDGVNNPDGTEHKIRSYSSRCLLSVIRFLVPPHRDNEGAAAYFSEMGQSKQEYIEWSVVRPGDLIDKDEVSKYDISMKASSSLFGNEVSRINVAHFMCELVCDEKVWSEWKYKFPVLHNTKNKVSKKRD